MSIYLHYYPNPLVDLLGRCVGHPIVHPYIEIDFPQWKCRSKPDDQCVGSHPKIEDPHDFYCASIADQKCVPAGIEVQLTLLDEPTGLMEELRPFKEPARTNLTGKNDVLTLPSSQCGPISTEVAEPEPGEPAQ